MNNQSIVSRNRVAQLVEQEEYSSSDSGFDSRLCFLLSLILIIPVPLAQLVERSGLAPQFNSYMPLRMARVCIIAVYSEMLAALGLGPSNDVADQLPRLPLAVGVVPEKSVLKRSSLQSLIL